jgi:F-type H+-transporting ATPase subunit delta
MAEPTTIARPYAEAVFKLAQQTGTLEQWSEQLSAMAAIARHPQMIALIGDPNLRDAQRVQLVLELMGGEAPADVRSFVTLLAGNDRLTLLPEIRDRFEEYKDEVQGVVDAQIESAFALDDAQLKALVADLERRFKRRINPQVNVDPNLIGGVKVVVGDTVIDGSVRGKLAGMSAALRQA